MAGFHWVEMRKNPKNFRVIRQRGAGRLQTCRFQRIPESSQLKRQVIHPLIFPEKLVILTVGDYIVSVFGAAELTDTFTAKLSAEYSSAKQLFNVPIA